MTTNLTMAGYTLPLPSRWQETRYNRATYYRGFDGTILVDRRQSAAATYREVIVEWTDALPTERAAIEAAWSALLTSGAVTMTDPTGAVYTATFMPEAAPLSIKVYVGVRADNPIYTTLCQISISLRLT